MTGTFSSKIDRSKRKGRMTGVRSVFSAVLGSLALFAAGCASPEAAAPTKRFTEILYRYPQAQEPLQFPKLSPSTGDAIASSLRSKTITIIVHPAYSLFFRDERRSTYSEAKYDLLKFQLDSESQFISDIAKTGNILILVLPGNYQKDSIAPLSYTFYLNATTRGSDSVYYLYSESSSSGVLPVDTVLTLYGFLQKTKAERVLIGGGYIGRCQREFYNQIVSYIDKTTSYIVPEISTISPDDVTDKEAAAILSSIKEKDYTPVKKFIEKKNEGAANILPLPSDKVL